MNCDYVGCWLLLAQLESLPEDVVSLTIVKWRPKLLVCRNATRIPVNRLPMRQPASGVVRYTDPSGA